MKHLRIQSARQTIGFLRRWQTCFLIAATLLAGVADNTYVPPGLVRP
jgi:hypothetical protein